MKLYVILLLILSNLVGLKNATPQETLHLNTRKKLSQFPVRRWDMDAGLPSDMVVNLTQDTLGYIWFSTYKGISRFDGVNFQNFNHSSSYAIESVTIQCQALDHKGNLWFGSQKGLVYYENYEFVRDTLLSTLNIVSVEEIFFDKNTKSLWIGTTSEGVYRYNYDKLEHFPEFLEISKSVIKTINSDLTGNIWIGTEGGEVVKFNGTDFSAVLSDVKLGGIGSFYFSKSNNSWVAAENGVFKLVDDKLTKQKSVLVERANVIIEDIHNTLWIGSDNGLYRYHLDNGYLDVLNERKGFPNNIVRGLLADREGNLWVSTYRKGVIKLSDGLITNFSETEGLSSDLITAITQVDNNTVYVADEFGIINIIKNGQISNLEIKSDISKDRLKGILYDSKGNLWVSSYGGLVKLDRNGKETIYNSSTGFPTETIRLVYEDSQGIIWVGTRSNGLFRFLPNGELEVFDINNQLSSNYIMAIEQDLLGRILVVTKNGLNIIENNRVVGVLDISIGLPSNFAFNVYVDNNNVFWLSSNDGLIRVENDSEVFVYNIQNGLFDNTLFDVLEDDFGYFWMPTDVGIVRMSKQQLNQFAKGNIDSYTFRIFGRSDGMKNPRCTGATKSLKANDGRLFFTTTGGISIIDPSDVNEYHFNYKPFIEAMVVGEKIFYPSKKFVVHPGSNRIQFNYTLLKQSASDQILFRYKLEPFDNQWVNGGADRKARYTNIPPGNYTFSVQATNNQGQWSQDPVSIEVAVLYSWWQTIWFKLFVAIVLTYCIWIIYKARTYAVKKQKEELERLVMERTAQIDKQNKELEHQAAELNKLSIVASHTNNAILITSPTGEVEWVNEAFTRIYGFTLEEFTRKKGHNLAKISHDPYICYIIGKCFEHQEPTSYTIQVSTNTDEQLWIQTTLTPIKNDKGEVIKFVAIDTDITGLKEAEQEMIAMNDEIISQSEAILQQNEEIQAQRDESDQLNNLLISHNQKIEASIWYAHTIQKAMLPAKKFMDRYFENFIVFKPRDIVSGDFYWFANLPSTELFFKRSLLTVVDCTGHGVPGAFMSMIGSRLLSEIVTERNVTDPSEILVQLNRLVNIVLKQESEENIDGMDVALCLIEQSTDNNHIVTFSGANRPLYLLKNGADSFITIKGNRKTIGGIMPDLDAYFENHTITLSTGDLLVMNSDGYIDQNRDDGKKFTVLRMLELILDNSNLPLSELGDILDIRFDEYREHQPQRDDATVIGVKL